MNKFEILQCDNGWTLIISKREQKFGQHITVSRMVFHSIDEVLSTILEIVDEQT